MDQRTHSMSTLVQGHGVPQSCAMAMPFAKLAAELLVNDVETVRGVSPLHQRLCLMAGWLCLRAGCGHKSEFEQAFAADQPNVAHLA